MVTISVELTSDEAHALRTAVDTYFVSRMRSDWPEVAEQLHRKMADALEAAGYKFADPG
jgi:hypothetical protein